MFYFINHFIYLLIFLESGLFYWFFIDNEVTAHEYFFQEFIFIIFFNYYFNYNENKMKLNIDIIFKYFVLFFKTPSFFFNYIINIFKKIFVFLLYYKYRLFFNTLKFYFREHAYKYFIVWRPLFKKTSYFGYYRSNRSKWIK